MHICLNEIIHVNYLLHATPFKYCIATQQKVVKIIREETSRDKIYTITN
jgi:hypothetical protein